MAAPPRPKRQHFLMEPSFTPEGPSPTEQKPQFDVYALLRDHLKYVALIHKELERHRAWQQEQTMKVSELSSKVDNLISVAKDLKGRVDNAGSSTGSPVMGGSQPQEDDPEVQRLADRIDDALRVLRGEVNVPDAPSGNAPESPTTTVPPDNQFDPNSPVPSAPSQEALATDINYQDPNAR